jgi:hypothetical protein
MALISSLLGAASSQLRVSANERLSLSTRPAAQGYPWLSNVSPLIMGGAAAIRGAVPVVGFLVFLSDVLDH